MRQTGDDKNVAQLFEILKDNYTNLLQAANQFSGELQAEINHQILQKKKQEMEEQRIKEELEAQDAQQERLVLERIEREKELRVSREITTNQLNDLKLMEEKLKKELSSNSENKVDEINVDKAKLKKILIEKELTDNKLSQQNPINVFLPDIKQTENKKKERDLEEQLKTAVQNEKKVKEELISKKKERDLDSEKIEKPISKSSENSFDDEKPENSICFKLDKKVFILCFKDKFEQDEDDDQEEQGLSYFLENLEQVRLDDSLQEDKIFTKLRLQFIDLLDRPKTINALNMKKREDWKPEIKDNKSLFNFIFKDSILAKYMTMNESQRSLVRTYISSNSCKLNQDLVEVINMQGGSGSVVDKEFVNFNYVTKR